MKQTAREILHGKKYQIFRAVMVSFGEPLKKENCVTCVSDGLASLRKAYRKQFRTMANKQTYILKDLAVAYQGERYERDTITDEVARKMLAEFPEYKALFEYIPEEKKKPAGEKKEKESEGKE